MNQESLQSRTHKGLLWSSIERFGSQGVQFVFSIILARLLSPDAYGVIAMPLIFLSIAQVFIDSGFSNALIRKPDLQEEDLSTAFYFNILVGVFCYAILFVSSPWIADFYNTPILSRLLKVTALATLFNPLCVVQQALLTKALDFKKQAYISVFASVSAGILGIYLAYRGYGVWSLVFQQVLSSLIRIILLWSLSTWRPRSRWSKESFSYLWGYGSKLLASGLINTVFENLYTVVIGKFFNAQSLGLYTKAKRFSELPSSNITGVIQRVTFPVLSEIQNEDERLRVNYRKMLRLSAFLIFPLMTGLASVASPLVYVLIGEQWMGCVILLQIISASLMLYPIHAINLNLLQVKGRSDLFLKLEIIKKCISVLVLCITIPQGIVAMCIGSVLVSYISLFINTYYTGVLINVGFLTQLRDVLPIFIVCVAMFAAVYSAVFLFNNPYLQLILGFTIGVLLFFLLSRIFLPNDLDLAIQCVKKMVH